MNKTTLMVGVVIVALATCNAGADSLFTRQTSSDGILIAARQSRFEVGDIITVMVQETIQSSAQASTNTKKESGVYTRMPAASNQFLVGEDSVVGLDNDQLPNWRLDSKNETKNTGTTQRTYTLRTTVACTITEILPNGNLRLQGARKISMNREESTLSVSGVVRPQEVSTAHVVDSQRMAEADITLRGQGPLWNNQRRGLVTRFLDWVSPS